MLMRGGAALDADAAVAAPLEDAGVADLDADQDYLHQADRYEAQYNFRFEVGLHA